MKKRFLFLSLLFGVGQVTLCQESEKLSSWHIGVEGGIPFGVSTFSSFGGDKTYIGFSGGLYGGYRFNPLLSVEASASYLKMGLSGQECCIDKGYWLGSDGMHYNAPILGEDGWDYANLKSEVNLQKYGVRMNINLLELCHFTTIKRWSINLSPALYAIGSKASIKTISNNYEALKGDNKWHLGVGGDVMAEYAFTRNISAGIFTGITYLTGKGMDGLPEYRHRNNYVWQTGIRLGWRFSSIKTKGAKANASVTPHVTTTPLRVEVPQQNPISEAITDTSTEVPTLQTNKEASTPQVNLAFPIINFSFNSVWIEPSQRNAIKAIVEILECHPKAKIVITGYADCIGSKEANQRVSLQRAQAVQNALEKCHIDKERITTVGGGIYYDNTNRVKARNATTTQFIK